MMDHRDRSRGQLGFPDNWDVIHDGASDQEALDKPQSPAPSPEGPPPLIILAASWADLVTVLAVVTAALLVLAARGHHGAVIMFPWAAALGGCWWIAAAATLLLVRQGTPGMLLAGIAFESRIAPQRVGFVVVVAAIQAIFLGLPGLLGGRRSPLVVAAASDLRISIA